MKKALIAVLFLIPVTALAEKPNPADYAVKIHVSSSHTQLDCFQVNGGDNLCAWEQYLTVQTEGKRFELKGPTTSKKNIFTGGTMVLRTGDYQAKSVKTNNEHSYEYAKVYEFLFPDGETRQYFVVSESE